MHPPGLVPGATWGAELWCPTPGHPTAPSMAGAPKASPPVGLSPRVSWCWHICGSAPSLPGWGPGQHPARGTQEGAGTPKTHPNLGAMSIHGDPGAVTCIRSAAQPWHHGAGHCTAPQPLELRQAGPRLPSTCHTGHPLLHRPDGLGDGLGTGRGCSRRLSWAMGQGS